MIGKGTLFLMNNKFPRIYNYIKYLINIYFQYEEVQRVLRDEIVNPLRKRLFVRADRVLTLRRLLDSLSSVSGLMDQEKDPEEFLNSLLNQVKFRLTLKTLMHHINIDIDYWVKEKASPTIYT